MEGWLHLPTRNKSTLALRELSAGLSSLKQFKLDEAMKHFGGTYGRERTNEHIAFNTHPTTESDRLAKECNSIVIQSRVLVGKGYVASFLGDTKSAIQLTEKALEFQRELDEPELEKNTLDKIVTYYEMVEDWDLAISSLKRRLWLEEDPSRTENLQERVKQLERRRTFADNYWPVPHLSRLSDQEMDERVDIGRITYQATVNFLRNRASCEREYAKSLRRVVSGSRVPVASEGVANTLRGIMYESAVHDAVSHEKYADMLTERANEIEKHSKLGQTNLNESRELYRRAVNAVESASSSARKAKQIWTERLRGEETQFAKVKEIETNLIKERTKDVEKKKENIDVEEVDIDEDKKRRLEDEAALVSAKRRLEAIQQRVELATNTKSEADENQKRFQSVAKIAKRRYGYVLLRNDEARLQECLLAFRSIVNATGTLLTSLIFETHTQSLILYTQVHFIARVSPELNI